MRSNKTLDYFTANVCSRAYLSSKEKEIVTSRLKNITLQKIGVKFGVTEARIRQIEGLAIRKIKNKIHQLQLFN